MTSQQQGGLRPSRRTLVKGAAWSVPVVAVAGTAPAWAASPGPVDPSYQPGTFCKHTSGGRFTDYHAVFCFDNTSDQDITVTFTRFTVGGRYVETIVPRSVTIPAGESLCTYVDGVGFPTGEESNARLDFTYEYNGDTIAGSIMTGDETHQVTVCGTHPREDQPGDRPPHPPYPNTDGITPDLEDDSLEAEEPVEETDEPTTDPVEPVTEDAPSDAPAEDTQDTQAPEGGTDEAATTAGPNS